MSHSHASPQGRPAESVGLFRRISIGRRFALLAVLIALLLGGVVFTFVGGIRQIVDVCLAYSENLVVDGHKSKLMVATQAAANLMGKALEGVQDPQKRVDILRNMVNEFRYESDQSGYFFVYQGTTVVAHANKDLQGKDMGDNRDTAGVAFIRDLATKAREGGGFVRYVFPKQGKGEQPKLSYAAMIPGTDLWVGTGVYIDNVEDEKARLRSASQEKSQGVMRHIAIIVAVCSLLFAVFLAYLIASVVRPIQEATQAAQEMRPGTHRHRAGGRGERRGRPDAARPQPDDAGAGPPGRQTSTGWRRETCRCASRCALSTTCSPGASTAWWRRSRPSLATCAA